MNFKTLPPVTVLALAAVLVLALSALLGVLVSGRMKRKKREDRCRSLLSELGREPGTMIVGRGRGRDLRVFTLGLEDDGYRVTDGDGTSTLNEDEVMHRLLWAEDIVVRKGPAVRSRES